MAKLTALQALSLDIVNNKVEKYSNTEANDVLRNAILEAMGTSEWDMYAFQENKYKVFKILSETITIAIAQKTIDKYRNWIEIKDVALGDIAEFKVMNGDLFKVGYVADGTNQLRRQRLTNGRLAMTSFPMGLKIYEELVLFMTGRIDWNDLVNRVVLSLDQEIANLIVRQIEGAYTGLDAKFVQSGSLNDEKLLELVQRVEAKTGVKATIYGTRKSISKLKPDMTYISNSDREDMRNLGHVSLWNGVKVVEIPQTLDANNDFVLADNMLFILPEGENKLVKLAFEGDAFIQETNEGRMDLQLEYLITRKVQLGVVKGQYYGVYHSI